MSNEIATVVSNLFNSKNGPFYTGIASISILVLANMLITNNYSISNSGGNISTCNTSNVIEASAKS